MTIRHAGDSAADGYCRPMWSGTIREDGEDPRRRGTPPAYRLLIEPEGGNGRQLSIRHGQPNRADDAKATFVAEIPYREFAECPICREPGLASREHVPQGSIGGQVRTLTCSRCNNGLGSRLEAEFTDWCFDRLVHVGAEGGAVPGRRRIPRVYRRWTDEGQFLWVLDGQVDPVVREMLRDGGLSMFFRLPDPSRWRLAALKHAYLAACCSLGGIPDSPEADLIRAELVRVRDAPPGLGIEVSPLAAELGIGRTDQAPTGPPLALMLVPRREPEAATETWISLAGAVLVRWPLADTPAPPPASSDE
jgi:hypothetical protein